MINLNVSLRVLEESLWEDIAVDSEFAKGSKYHSLFNTLFNRHKGYEPPVFLFPSHFIELFETFDLAFLNEEFGND